LNTEVQTYRAVLSACQDDRSVDIEIEEGAHRSAA
jgi:hypothetical protein